MIAFPSRIYVSGHVHGLAGGGGGEAEGDGGGEADGGGGGSDFFGSLLASAQSLTADLASKAESLADSALSEFQNEQRKFVNSKGAGGKQSPPWVGKKLSLKIELLKNNAHTGPYT